MKTINIGVRVDESLKDLAYEKIKTLGTTPADLIRDVLQYVVDNDRLPVSREILSEQDKSFYEMVRQRLNTANSASEITEDEFLTL